MLWTSRAEHERKVTGLAEGREEPSQNLSLLLEELAGRGSRRAVAHFQASILSGDRMAVKGPRDLQDLYLRLAPHERNYLYLKVLDKRASLGRDQGRAYLPAAGRGSGDGCLWPGIGCAGSKSHDEDHDHGETMTQIPATTGRGAALTGELSGPDPRTDVRGRGRQDEGAFEGGSDRSENGEHRVRGEERDQVSFER